MKYQSQSVAKAYFLCALGLFARLCQVDERFELKEVKCS